MGLKDKKLENKWEIKIKKTQKVIIKSTKPELRNKRTISRKKDQKQNNNISETESKRQKNIFVKVSKTKDENKASIIRIEVLLVALHDMIKWY